MKSTDWYTAMDNFPLWWATVATAVIFIAILVGVWLVRREVVYDDAPDLAPWRDLRVWATVLILIQLTIYFLFS